ncbi:hypothetical protein KYK30_09770 [Shinella yambaruensis]|uniref:Uncharacterized protein n=1 Tax=Shinella yambaruensis TaxID=415996 RepID=A0ABQ5ZX35_9HYPH|nr:hypothetical protein [Shinella yambaruensis]MCJ8027911.1 hypothetical protein [Shinella yambaruensis]MCU7979981.1 hypothetical protein [Shinella yambaruensis]GLR55267.1 hypothetical protein GCM10007923_64900 [Shinella yambaruensis]
MALNVSQAEAILKSKFGEPAKPPTDYVVGFKTPAGKVLAIHREATETRIWFQPPPPPPLDGVRLMDNASNGNSNINGPLLPLRAPTTLRVEVDSPGALNRFLGWYADPGSAPRAITGAAAIDPRAFREAFARFQALITARSGHAFNSFHEGLAAAWENYKPRLRDHALGLLRIHDWSEAEIGSGTILNRMIEAIEIQDSRSNLTNNLVFWQNRYGHANRDHRALLEAASNPKLRRELEGFLFGLFHGGADEGSTFDRLSELTGGKYPLLAYFYFLKDMDRFMPIQPTGFDRAFRALGIDFSTLRQCSWKNYSTYNQTLAALRPLIEASIGLNNIRLVDAHSFCWIFTTLMKLEAEGVISNPANRSSDGRIVGGWERSIIEMRMSILNTVRNSNGQIVERVVKDKQLLMDASKLDELIRSRLELQQGKCNLTGLTMHAHGSDADPNLLPSADRIDSSRHYEIDNIQVVCRFINFWKGASDNAEFERLLMMVRGVDQ